MASSLAVAHLCSVAYGQLKSQPGGFLGWLSGRGRSVKEEIVHTRCPTAEVVVNGKSRRC